MSHTSLDDIAQYYSAKIKTHGGTPQGVDWNGKDSQQLRFQQLSKIIQQSACFSVADLGCGYGALYSYLEMNYTDFNYQGYDISSAMIEHAQSQYNQSINANFVLADKLTERVDYAVASGIFNVRQQHSEEQWFGYIIQTLDNLNHYSQKGFAFNCLTIYSDLPKMRSNLYYADPCRLFDHCKKHYSKNIALLHDYDLYEFTLLVRKSND